MEPKNRTSGVDLTATKDARQTAANPVASSTISISIPDTLQIRLVDAAAASDYEIWGGFASISLSAFVGAVTALCQQDSSPGALKAFTVFVGLLTICFSAVAAVKRGRISRKVRTLRFAVGDAIED